MAREGGLDKKMDDIAHFIADTILDNRPVDPELNAAFKGLTAYWEKATKLDKVTEDADAAKSGGMHGVRDRLKAV